ncbi:MAG: hypothetical protein AVDCRST_MAG51-2916, partial [uncultured Ramlibacter sp.]
GHPGPDRRLHQGRVPANPLRGAGGRRPRCDRRARDRPGRTAPRRHRVGAGDDGHRRRGALCRHPGRDRHRAPDGDHQPELQLHAQAVGRPPHHRRVQAAQAGPHAGRGRSLDLL